MSGGGVKKRIRESGEGNATASGSKEICYHDATMITEARSGT